MAADVGEGRYELKMGMVRDGVDERATGNEPWRWALLENNRRGGVGVK